MELGGSGRSMMMSAGAGATYGVIDNDRQNSAIRHLGKA
jgi:hypothetical protein